MLWILKRTVTVRRFFWAAKTYAKKYGEENIYNFSLKKNCLSKPKNDVPYYKSLWSMVERDQLQNLLLDN